VRVAVGPQVAACERFMEFSWEVIGTEPWTGRPISEDLAELLIAGEMSRAFKSYRGVIDAALGGYGPQGRRKPAFTGLSGGLWRRWESNPRPQSRVNGFYERSRRSDLVPR